MRRLLRSVALPLHLALLAFLESQAAAAQERAPNVVLIVADDLGWSDLGSYGGEIETPQLDRLAFAGVRFSRFYVTPRCSPTRAALLTGRWPHEVGVGHLNRDWQRPAYRGAIRDDVPTLAESLRARGYVTWMTGKWHLTPGLARDGATPPAPEALRTTPIARGFDRFYGTLAGSGSHFEPPHLYDGEQPARLDTTAGRTLTDAIGERGARWIAEHLDGGRTEPFFLYLAFTAPHWPLHARPEEIARYASRFDDGWDTLRAERFRRLRELGLVAPDAELPPRDAEVPPWESVAEKEWQARRMEVYAAMVSAMDRAVGDVVATLEQRGVLDDTLILFLSDNGATAEEMVGLYRLAPFFIPIPERTADGREVRFGDQPSITPGPPDTFSTYGRGWAHLSNTPLRSYKHWTHEGGVAAPFLVHWPAGIAGRAGAIVHAPAHVVDVAPTVLAIAGKERDAATPDASSGDAGDGTAAHHRSGASLWPVLRGDDAAPRTLFWEHEGNRAILDGRFKLVSRWPGPWQLYDLEGDRFETSDLAASDPERVAALDRQWAEWAVAVGVESWPMVVPEVRAAFSAALALFFVLFSALRFIRARSRGQPRSAPTTTRRERARPRAGSEPTGDGDGDAHSGASTRRTPSSSASTAPEPQRPPPIVPR